MQSSGDMAKRIISVSAQKAMQDMIRLGATAEMIKNLCNHTLETGWCKPADCTLCSIKSKRRGIEQKTKNPRIN